ELDAVVVVVEIGGGADVRRAADGAEQPRGLRGRERVVVAVHRDVGGVDVGDRAVGDGERAADGALGARRGEVPAELLLPRDDAAGRRLAVVAVDAGLQPDGPLDALAAGPTRDDLGAALPPPEVRRRLAAAAPHFQDGIAVGVIGDADDVGGRRARE